MLTLVLTAACSLSVSSTPPAGLRETPSSSSLRAWHDLLGSEPHVAGTPGDERQIERLRSAFEAMGLKTEMQWIHPLLCRPVEGLVELIESGAGSAPDAAQPGRRGVIALPLRERNLAEDPATAHPDLTYGWNAYSGSGDVTAEVVYAHHATREDFAALAAAGVSVEGRIVLARYGRSFRGSKARAAEEAGAAALLLFSDPADVAKGPVYPDGGWANDSCIQRGSLLALEQPGDPLTPHFAATENAKRLSVDEVGLPRIPVQPIGYAAAGLVLSRLGGSAAPQAWQGGLAMTYRLGGSATPLVRVKVEQVREIMKTANVTATLTGAVQPDQLIIVGCHHDAWGFGAADPLAGTIVLMETAKAFAEAARQGWKPHRTIIFAAWAAEEFGIIGSTEWCERNASRLARGGVAYVNLDMAAMGTDFGAKAAPSLMRIIREAAGTVSQAREPGSTALEAWTRRGAGIAPIGAIDGGSDHEAFQYRIGIPCCTLFASGAAGTSYHSNYDTLAWYRSVIGEDYEPALMVSRICAEIVRALADEPVPAMDQRDVVERIRVQLAELATLADTRHVTFDAAPLDEPLANLARAAEHVAQQPRGTKQEQRRR